MKSFKNKYYDLIIFGHGFFSFCSYGVRELHVSTSYSLRHYHPGKVTIAVCNNRGSFQTHFPVSTVFVSHYLVQAGLELSIL